MNKSLEHRWSVLAATYCSYTALIQVLFKKLQEAYQSASRHYHNFSHLENMFRLTDVYASELKRREVVDFSIFYHDVVYQPGRTDNEENSAAMAEEDLQQLGVPAGTIDVVIRFILDTKNHKTKQKDAISDLDFFLDFDMAVLGSVWKEYDAYRNNIRSEFMHLSDADYRAGRCAFLKKWLREEYIFKTKAFQTTYEKPARSNLYKESQLLSC